MEVEIKVGDFIAKLHEKSNKFICTHVNNEDIFYEFQQQEFLGGNPVYLDYEVFSKYLPDNADVKELLRICHLIHIPSNA